MHAPYTEDMEKPINGDHMVMVDLSIQRPIHTGDVWGSQTAACVTDIAAWISQRIFGWNNHPARASQRSLAREAYTKTNPKAVGIPGKVFSVKK